MQYTNVASRILSLATAIQAAREHGTSVSISVWPEVLSETTGKEEWDEQEITRYLLSALDEIQILQQTLQDRDVPPEVYHHYLARVSQSFAPSLLSKSWQEVCRKFDQHALTVLTWASLYLGNEEQPVSDEDMQEINELIFELEEKLSLDGVPQALRAAAQRHLSSLRQALFHYSVAGIRPIKEAVEQSFGALRTEEEVFKEAAKSGKEGSKELISALGKLLGKTTDVIDKASRTAGSTASLIEIGKSAWRAAIG